MVVRVDGLNVECEEFLFPASDNKGEGGVGTKDIPKDIAKESEDCSENVKTEEEETCSDHTYFLVSVINPFLWPKVRCLVSLMIFSWPMEPSLLPHLVHVPVWVVLFSWYTLSPILYPEGNVDQVVNKPIWQMTEERWCQHGY